MREIAEEKQGKRGGKRRPSVFTERAVARAGRACPDRVIRILRDGVIELVPMTGEADGSENSTPLEEWRKRRGQG